MDRQRQLLFYLALGAMALYLGVAVAILVDDFRMRRAMEGRWKRLDRAIGDVEENSTLTRLERQREQAAEQEAPEA